MPGRWSDEWRDRGYRSESGRRDDEPRRWQGDEDRSFGQGDRVFGERDTGAGYNRPRGETSYSREELERRSNWQDERYEGVSPAMRRGEYDSGYRANPRFSRQDYTRSDYGSRSGGGRYYGDDGRSGVYRENYGQGGREYGDVPRGYDEGQRFGSREADARWRREMSGGGNPYGSYDAGSYGARTFSGGTGGYDYERGYGDGGRENRGREEFEDRAREAGDFFRRTGEKVKSWFNDLGGDDRDRDAYRGARGLGPKGYQRSDERVSEEVHQRLTDDSWLDASGISVSVSGGEVTLSGTVESREAKHRAERIVEDLSGVSHVQNNLRVQPGNYFTSAGRGYGDSANEARMRNDNPEVKDVTDGKAASPLRKDS
jgi:osmotically-inducible protein OsmY